MSLCLYVGMDDSNHAGEIQGEINFATFSMIRQDSIVRTFPNRRDYLQAQKWMKHPCRDYRFTILTGEPWRTKPDNLVRTAPVLINSFLQDYPHLELDAIRLYLDGNLDSSGKESLRICFRDMDFAVKNFVKKGKNRKGHMAKRPVCPSLVYMADIWAHMLLGKSVEECFGSQKYVPFSPKPEAQ